MTLFYSSLVPRLSLLSGKSLGTRLILVLSSANVELTSILVPSYRLRVMALLTYGSRATVESLSSVHSSLPYLTTHAM